MVTQVYEQHSAVIPHSMNPTGQTDGLADIGRAEAGAGMAPIGVHHVLQQRKRGALCAPKTGPG